MPLLLLLGLGAALFFVNRAASAAGGGAALAPITCVGILGSALGPAIRTPQVGDQVTLAVKGSRDPFEKNVCFFGANTAHFNVQATIISAPAPIGGNSPSYVYGITSSDVPPQFGFHVGTTVEDFASAIDSFLN
jgi:hypothetical protein